VVPLIDTVKTPWGQRLIPIAELERFMAEHREVRRPRAAPRSARRPPVLPEVVAARIRLEHAGGRTLGEIARGLNAGGVPTAHGARRWWPSSVRSILVRSHRRPGADAIA